jgi:hypothetical protein
MGKTFNESVRKQFASAIATVAPQFKPMRAPAEYAWAGERAFVWDAKRGIRCWVSLVTSPKGYNEFFVEIGWSTLGRYPELLSRPTLAGMESATDVLKYSEMMCRLSSVGDTPGSWRYLPAGFDQAALEDQLRLEVEAALVQLEAAEAQVVVKPLVDQSINSLLRFGIPFLERSVQQLQATGRPSDDAV